MAHASVHRVRSVLGALGKTAGLVLVVLLLETHVVLAAIGGIPGPGDHVPGPPSPPCISTAPIFAPNHSICWVRNVGVGSHFVRIDIRGAGNLTLDTLSELLAPGVFDGLRVDVSNAVSCVVTTDEGTTKALEDLAVELQVFTTSTGHAGETEGRMFQQCAPATPLP